MALSIFLQSDPDQFNGFLLFGYIALGIIAVAYIGYLYIQQRNIQKDLELMEQLLEDDET
jgi:hypothetical protein